MVLKGKIVTILDDKRVVVNLGYKDGVKRDMKFFIYAEGEEIIDPDMHKSLGKKEIVKHKIKVNHIQENFTVMESDEYFRTALDLFLASNTFTRQSSFKLEKNYEKKDEDLVVKVGDLVREDIG